MDNNKSFFSRKWVLRLSSLILALMLFAYVNGSKNGFLRQTTRGSNENSALMSDKSATIRMPLDITVDNSKYVVTGYPQYVKVRITGPSALVTTTTNTQNFKVYTDLSKLTPGRHQVPIKTSGLNSELKAEVLPKNINVRIQPRRTISMKVMVRVNARNLDDNYQAGRGHADVNTVQVTGAQDQVARVDRIVAYVVVPRDAKSTLQRQVTLQAVDKNGQILNVAIVPTTTNVTVPINARKDNDESNATNSSSADSSSTGGTATSSSNKKKVQTGSSSSSISSNTNDNTSSAESSSSQS
ncbi:YbbR-like domain-containing protein [Limosilactobacillus sp.]|uniref:CdaR family protein n=1 Tax=Limosilactobacillus sp. TaxID=2773925 RepID=UPI0035A14D9F